jgi:phospholipid/cholesterol/gamma-HCH transport system permease protein
VASCGIVFVTSVFIGMVMAVQFAFGLRKFGGMEYTGRVIALSFARELAPSLTAIIVGGRIGSGMAAEVGAMNVTEQIDAVRALGADPLKKLVWPRLVASVIVMPILGGFALVLGFTGAMIVTDLEFQVPAAFFYRSAISVVTLPDVLAGLMKTPVFGAIIALVGCHFGLTTTGGTAGVGTSTTRSVVTISIAILIADLVLTKLGILIWPSR